MPTGPCEHDRIKEEQDKLDREEKRKWSQTARTCIIILTSVATIFGINWMMASQYSEDDVGRSVLSSLAAGIGGWLISNIKGNS